MKVLIATDVSARGIDISDVDYVINYDLPDVAENYVHRVGRTGRGIKKGIAVSFCSEEERPMLEEIEAFMDKKIAVADIEKEEYVQTLVLSQDAVSDWKTLLKEDEKLENVSRQKKKIKPKKKK